MTIAEGFESEPWPNTTEEVFFCEKADVAIA